MTSTTAVEITSASRVEFLTWGDESVDFYCGGSLSATTQGWTANFWAGLDGAASSASAAAETVSPANTYQSVFSVGTSAMSEGYHYVSALASTSSGQTINFANVSSNAIIRG